MYYIDSTKYPQNARYLVAAIDSSIEKAAAKGRKRKHLGASSIGRLCDREIWYTFRWAHTGNSFDGRMLRLFDRGQMEESRFIRYLRGIGCKVQDTNSAGRQFGFSDIDGHFCGSYDGIASNIPGRDSEEKVLLEFKTHNTKSFMGLTQNGVAESKPEHVSQMQVYMHYSKTKTALYLAVNKDDDHIHAEFIPYDEAAANDLIQRAKRIIYSEAAPEGRKTSLCWWCSYKKLCSAKASADRNCRTCEYSVPTGEVKWICTKRGTYLPASACNFHKYREGMAAEWVEDGKYYNK